MAAAIPLMIPPGGILDNGRPPIVAERHDPLHSRLDGSPRSSPRARSMTMSASPDPFEPGPVPAGSMDAAGRPWPNFAHASEAEMARILDFYSVRWDYEPRTFPILWNLDGDVVESFSPDFHLPELDLYLEMTTLKQRLVRKKNRKLRRMRELYPDIRIKLFYARDFRAMLLKYGRLALADSLSGSLGQVVPERSRPIEPAVEPIRVSGVSSTAPAIGVEPRRRRSRAAAPADAVIESAAGRTTREAYVD